MSTYMQLLQKSHSSGVSGKVLLEKVTGDIGSLLSSLSSRELLISTMELDPAATCRGVSLNTTSTLLGVTRPPNMIQAAQNTQTMLNKDLSGCNAIMHSFSKIFCNICSSHFQRQSIHCKNYVSLQSASTPIKQLHCII